MPEVIQVAQSTVENDQIQKFQFYMLDNRYHAQSIFKGFAKVRKSAQLQIFALLFYKNGLMKQKFQL